MDVSLNTADCIMIVLPLVSHDKACNPGLLHPSMGRQAWARIKQE